MKIISPIIYKFLKNIQIDFFNSTLYTYIFLFSFSLLASQEIDPGNIQLLRERNQLINSNSKTPNPNMELLTKRVMGLDSKEVKNAILEASDSLDPKGLAVLKTAYIHAKNTSIKTEIIRAIGRYRSPEGELLLSSLIVSSTGEEVFYDFIEELKNMNSIPDRNGKIIQYRPYSENLIHLFIKLVNSSSLSNDQKGAVILAMGETKDERFRDVLKKIMDERNSFIRDLAKLIFEENFIKK
ncbi:MAG: hypothetical protein L6Q54_03890 [Leptospiraceae bacterium]|nr:hypothetical protein [Leptospiraceae bacterium]MCK6380377.1 hypothetical protein [Leptospiraceae bacterium]NUM41312.1 hypothetical protein [Leptospiraceae bacterium]